MRESGRQSWISRLSLTALAAWEKENTLTSKSALGSLSPLSSFCASIGVVKQFQFIHLQANKTIRAILLSALPWWGYCQNEISFPNFILCFPSFNLFFYSTLVYLTLPFQLLGRTARGFIVWWGWGRFLAFQDNPLGTLNLKRCFLPLFPVFCSWKRYSPIVLVKNGSHSSPPLPTSLSHSSWGSERWWNWNGKLI